MCNVYGNALGAQRRLTGDQRTTGAQQTPRAAAVSSGQQCAVLLRLRLRETTARAEKASWPGHTRVCTPNNNWVPIESTNAICDDLSQPCPLSFASCSLNTAAALLPREAPPTLVLSHWCVIPGIVAALEVEGYAGSLWVSPLPATASRISSWAGGSKHRRRKFRQVVGLFLLKDGRSGQGGITTRVQDTDA